MSEFKSATIQRVIIFLGLMLVIWTLGMMVIDVGEKVEAIQQQLDALSVQPPASPTAEEGT